MSSLVELLRGKCWFPSCVHWPIINISNWQTLLLIRTPVLSLYTTLWNANTSYEMSHTSFCPRRPSMWMLQRPQNKQLRRRKKLFISATFGDRKFWEQCFLVIETFEAFHSCPPRVNQRCPSSRPSQVGHPLFSLLHLIKTKAVLARGVAWSRPCWVCSWGVLEAAALTLPARLLWLKKSGELYRSLQCQEQI